MTIPFYLQEAIEKELEGFSISNLSETAKNVSDNYRNMTGYVSGKEQVKAYIAYRMAATYAALYYVLDKLKQRIPDFSPTTLLDVGAGPGTSLWTFLSVFNSLNELYLYENENDMIYAGKRLMEFIPNITDYNVNWVKADATSNIPFKQSDIVTASYMLNELQESKRESFLKKLWESTLNVLVLIEPGTPEGYRRIEEAKSILFIMGAHSVIPCVHNNPCPMNADDWCHFTVRVDRPKFLKLTKNAVLSYEDEKFSYVCLSKQPCVNTVGGIVIRHPQTRKGHVLLDLCTDEGIHKCMFSKKDGDDYKRAKKLNWGDDI